MWGCWRGGGRTAATGEKEAGRFEVAHGKQEAGRPKVVSDEEEIGRLPEVFPDKENASWAIGTGKGGGRAVEEEMETVAAAWRLRRVAMVLCLLFLAV